MRSGHLLILLQIVMVGPGTHIVKNHMCGSPEPLSPSSKTQVPGSFVTTQLI